MLSLVALIMITPGLLNLPTLPIPQSPSGQQEGNRQDADCFVQVDGKRVPCNEDLVPAEIILKTQRAPEYPPAARGARVSGIVLLEVTILDDGSVGGATVLESTHILMGFEQAAVDALMLWRFEPATYKGKPIESTRKFRMSFNYAGVGGPSGGSAGGPLLTGVGTSFGLVGEKPIPSGGPR